MKKTISVLLLFCSVIYSQGIDRISGSPYPASAKPDTLYKVMDNKFAAGQLLTIGTLQGLLAKKQPKIYRVNSPSYNIWLEDLSANYGVVVNEKYESDFQGLVKHFKSEINGYILCSTASNSVNVAISLSGILNAVAVSGDYKDFFESLGIPLLLDVRDKDEKWFFDNYGQQINKDIFCFQKESNLQFLADYATFGNMITFYNSEFTSWTDEIMNSFNPGAALLGWGFDEYGLVDKASDYSIYIHAADYANNLSALSNFNAETKQKKQIKEIARQENVHYVCFLMTDGDNIQWDLGNFSTDSKWYGSSKRGETSIGWTMAPALCELAPTVLKKLYEQESVTETGRDYFVAGPSGVGYIFPEKYKDLTGFAERTNAFMGKSDLRILNLLGNSDKDEYLEPFLKQDNIDAIIYYFYSNYSGGNGKIKWVNDKPVLYGRYQLWQPGFENSTSLAQKLNNSSTDVYSADAYSLIPVHVWSQSIEDVIDCVERLNSNVVVVTPDEFVKLINMNLKPKAPLLNIVPNNNETELKFLLPEFPGSGYDSLHRWADSTDKAIYRFNRDQLSQIADVNEDLLLTCIVANEFIVSVTGNLNDSLTQVARWRTKDTHIHGGWNKTEVKIDLRNYFNDGWNDVYLVFEDGIPSDAFGPLISSFVLTGTSIVSVKDDKQYIGANKFALNQNYPNPFNPATSITFMTNNPGMVRLDIYDTLGQKINTLVNAFRYPGSYNAVWEGDNYKGENVSSGIYFYTLSFEGKYKTKKMLLIR